MLLTFFSLTFYLLLLDLLGKLLTFYVEHPNQFSTLKPKHFVKCRLTHLEALLLCIHLHYHIRAMKCHHNNYYHIKAQIEEMETHNLFKNIPIFKDYPIVVIKDLKLIVMDSQDMDYMMVIQNLIVTLVKDVGNHQYYLLMLMP